MRSLLAVGCVLIGAGPAAAQSCGEAWFQRNNIIKQAGYCFTTPRAIEAFGNNGCLYDNLADVPLSARQRAAVEEIRSFEKTRGCTP